MPQAAEPRALVRPPANVCSLFTISPQCAQEARAGGCVPPDRLCRYLPRNKTFPGSQEDIDQEQCPAVRRVDGPSTPMGGRPALVRRYFLTAQPDRLFPQIPRFICSLVNHRRRTKDQIEPGPAGGQCSLRSVNTCGRSNAGLSRSRILRAAPSRLSPHE